MSVWPERCALEDGTCEKTPLSKKEEVCLRMSRDRNSFDDGSGSAVALIRATHGDKRSHQMHSVC